MPSDLRLVIFDVDGTLVDSQGDIVAAMRAAFSEVGLPVVARERILGIVGLSLDVAMQRLVPDAPTKTHLRMVQAYKDSYMTLRAKVGAAQSSPLYPGALSCLHNLSEAPDTLLGVATGKSRRGLDKLLEAHDLQRFFVTQQVADHHPSKPNPSMLFAAMQETGVDKKNSVMVGDTSFDMDMARSAGIAGIGVTWGYHRPDALAAAAFCVDRFEQLPDALCKTIGVTA